MANLTGSAPGRTKRRPDKKPVESLGERAWPVLGPPTLASREKSRADAILGETLFILFFDSCGLGFPLAEIGVNLGAVVEVIVDNRIDVGEFESGVAHHNLFRRRALVERVNHCTDGFA